MIFDYIAEACRKIIDFTDDCFFEEFQSITSSYRQKLEDELKKQLPLFFENGGYRMLDDGDLSNSSQFGKQFSMAIHSALKDKSYDKALYFIQCVCNGISQYIKNLTIFPSDYRYFDYLNNNSEETNIVVLPKFRSDWQHSNMWKSFGYSINNYLTNIYIIDIAKFKGKYKINNYILSYDLFKEEYESGKLVIGISPVTCKPSITSENVELSEVDGKGFFSVKDLLNSEEITENVKSIYKKAKELGINILMFPEMLGIENHVEEIESMCMELSPVDNNPKITILPSVWKNRENHTNILIGEFNKPISQKKFFRYPYQDADGQIFLEDLNLDGENVINILHVDKIGRIVVAICKDLLMKEHLDFLIEDLKATLILVPSFSTGDYPFKMISYYGYPYDCNIVWVNSCSAKYLLQSVDDDVDTVGIVYNPSRLGVDDSVTEFKKSDCDGQCNKCIYKFEIKFKGCSK